MMCGGPNSANEDNRNLCVSGIRSLFCSNVVKDISGADPGGGGIFGVRSSPLPFLGDPKTSKRGENATRVRANVQRFST